MLELRVVASRLVAILFAGIALFIAVPAGAVTTITVDAPGCTNGGTLTWDSASRTVYCSGATTQPPAILEVTVPGCPAGTAPGWIPTQLAATCQTAAGATASASLKISVSLPDCITGAVTFNATTKTLTCLRAGTGTGTQGQILNVDGSTSSVYDSLTDGLIIMRYLMGIRGAALTAKALASTATRTDPAAVAAYLDSIRTSLDIDNNGVVDALTDGTLILRYLMGIRGASLVNGAIGGGAFNATAAGVEAKIQSLMP